MFVARPPHLLSAATSSWAPSSLLAVRKIRCSSLIGCRGGSVSTLWQTSLKSSAVMSRSSLWRIDGKPPWEQLRACSTENCLPQVHRRGKFDGCQPYLRQRASRKSTDSCATHSHILQLVAWTASLSSLSQLTSSLLFACY